MTKRGLLLIDRGSREKEAKDELAALCTMIKQIRPSDFVDYCFLEVLPPFIDEGITNALKHDLDELILVPYFLYPGKKVKAAVTIHAMAMQKNTKTKFLVTRPYQHHLPFIPFSVFAKDIRLRTSVGMVGCMLIGRVTRNFVFVFFCIAIALVTAALTFLPGYRKYGTKISSSKSCFNAFVIPSSINGGNTSKKQ